MTTRGAVKLTWDGDDATNVPRRPSTEDLAGDELVDDQEDPPGPDMPCATGHNQMVKQITALNRVADSCRISVTFSGGTPSISKLTSAKTPSLLLVGAFTVVDNGNGDTSITWPADTFPPHTCHPHSLTINSDTEIDRARIMPITNGVRIKTKLGATGTDADFTFCLG
ncbi:MAG TPA: hypothetical protein VHO25_24315 [Polyangiaceae bacterium]|nr:hypothetical protein [Polyangiaceae bacterium]